MGDSGETPLYEKVSKVGRRRDGFPFTDGFSRDHLEQSASCEASLLCSI